MKREGIGRPLEQFLRISKKGRGEGRLQKAPGVAFFVLGKESTRWEGGGGGFKAARRLKGGEKGFGLTMA